MRDIVVHLPVDPPDVDFIHYAECEDRSLFQCHECGIFVPDNEVNRCNECLKFIPRISSCVCDEIEVVKYRYDRGEMVDRIVDTNKMNGYHCGYK